jgi:hypothetical protein
MDNIKKAFPVHSINNQLKPCAESHRLQLMGDAAQPPPAHCTEKEIR